MKTNMPELILKYLSLSVREHLKTSGVAITPQPLKRPSPNERETSRMPSTRPSLKGIYSIKIVEIFVTKKAL